MSFVLFLPVVMIFYAMSRIFIQSRMKRSFFCCVLPLERQVLSSIAVLGEDDTAVNKLRLARHWNYVVSTKQHHPFYLAEP